MGSGPSAWSTIGLIYPDLREDPLIWDPALLIRVLYRNLGDLLCGSSKEVWVRASLRIYKGLRC